MEILSTDGDIKFNFSFSEEYRKILAYDNYIVLYGNGYIIGLDNEGEIFKYKSEDNIIKAVKDNRKIMILYNDKIDLGNF